MSQWIEAESGDLVNLDRISIIGITTYSDKACLTVSTEFNGLASLIFSAREDEEDPKPNLNAALQAVKNGIAIGVSIIRQSYIQSYAYGNPEHEDDAEEGGLG